MENAIALLEVRAMVTAIVGLDESVEWFANLTATGKDKLRNMDKASK